MTTTINPSSVVVATDGSEDATRAVDDTNVKVRRIVETEDAFFDAHPDGTLFRYPLIYGPGQLIPREWLIVRRILDGRRRVIVADGGLTLRTAGFGANVGHALALAARHPDVAGLITQGTLGVSWPDAVRFQMLDDALGYAMQFAENGKITPAALGKAVAGNGGGWAKGNLFGFLIDPSYTGVPGQAVAINAAIDTNHDGALDPETEVKPAAESKVDFTLKLRPAASR